MRNPLQWMNTMVTEAYYFWHFLAFFSYLVVRISSASLLSPNLTDHLLYREIQAVLAFTVLTVVKYVKEETFEAFISDTLFFAKVFLIPITLLMDYQLTLWYLLIFTVIHIFTQQPAFEVLGTSCKLTPLQLEDLLPQVNTSRLWLELGNNEELAPLILYMSSVLQYYAYANLELLLVINEVQIQVEFHASCSSNCVRTSRCFPELSITYSNKNLSFGIVDLGLFPNAAEKFGISLSGSMGQLPTYILFEHATEVTRFPELDSQAKPYHSPISKKLICRHFELDRLLLEYISAK